jgi:DNA-binding MarR family transcriptional regulator
MRTASGRSNRIMSQTGSSRPDGSQSDDPLSVALFSEMFMADQLARNRLSRALPKGMELSHFSVLNHLARTNEEKTPAQLARIFHVTRGAMTNTLNRLEWAGHIHVRPDWDDARRKLIAISPSGRRAREAAIGP